MASFKLRINGKEYTLEADVQMPLLWAIRDFAGLKGTKFGCGIAQCGACTVHLDGIPVRSCSIPVSAAVNRNIKTIEGLSENNEHPVQQAWIAAQVPQCGYCQSGQIMTAVALLEKNKNPNDADIDAAMQGVICRCGTYPRIRTAIKNAAGMMAANK
jgi:isoquinoline 1-oxidoreductase alpha subunit